MPDSRQIERLRFAKNPLNAAIPYHFLHEQEPDAQGQLEEVNTVFLTGRECAFRCLMCDLWKNTLDEPTPPGAILTQLDYALDRLPPARVIKLYNNGNFFDRKAIPPADYPGILQRLRLYGRLIVENHPKLCGDACLEFAHAFPGAFEIAMGLETIHPDVLPRLNKQISPDDFKQAAAFLTAHGIDVRAFALLNPPYLTGREENIQWTLRTVQFAFESGARCCSIIPTRPGNGVMDRLHEQGHYVPPSLDALEAVFEKALALRQGRVFVDTWGLDFFSHCTQCFEARKQRLEKMNAHQKPYQRIACGCLPPMSKNTAPYDLLVAGAGFAGSLTALILDQLGFRVCLLEKGSHPRFAIGESSTPVADILLRKLASEYNLPWLSDFSRYGSWQQTHPEVVCGIKRGFSYFKHFPGKDFFTDAAHSNELLVAASTDDRQSDTNWLRADFDAFLVNKVKAAGIDYFDHTEILSVERAGQWAFQTLRAGEAMTLTARFFLDATGGAGITDRLPEVHFSTDGFLTNSFAVFSHFNDVPAWTDVLRKAGIPDRDFPYNPDHSALHHVLDEGWLWALRFNDRRTSLGFVLDRGQQPLSDLPPEALWNGLLEKYPAIGGFMKDASLASTPGKLLRSGRLQRRISQAAGPGWAALPHTAGFVDPLFSSGIAQSLTGIRKLVEILHRDWDQPESLDQRLKEYEQGVFEEFKLIDLLVAGCYKTMAHFGLFNAWSMLYFVATIACEQQLLRNDPPTLFLGAGDARIREMAQTSYADLLKLLNAGKPNPKQIHRFTETIRQRIAPLNTAGLLDPSLQNMYRHTAATL